MEDSCCCHGFRRWPLSLCSQKLTPCLSHQLKCMPLSVDQNSPFLIFPLQILSPYPPVWPWPVTQLPRRCFVFYHPMFLRGAHTNKQGVKGSDMDIGFLCFKNKIHAGLLTHTHKQEHTNACLYVHRETDSPNACSSSSLSPVISSSQLSSLQRLLEAVGLGFVLSKPCPWF